MARSTICADTGNGASVTFASGITATLKFRRIVQPAVSIAPLTCSDISTTGFNKMVASDLTDPPEIELEYLWDTFDTQPTVGLAVGTMTITYPLRTGETTAATYAGTAYVSSVQHPTLTNGELQTGTVKLQYDGATGPAYTKST